MMMVGLRRVDFRIGVIGGWSIGFRLLCFSFESGDGVLHVLVVLKLLRLFQVMNILNGDLRVNCYGLSFEVL